MPLWRLHYKREPCLVNMINTSQKTLLLVDDDSVLQEFLQDFLRQQGFAVHGLLCGEDIEGFLQKQTIDLILLDVVLPEKDGYHWLKWLKENHANIPILMLSAKGQIDDRVQGLEQGANDYIVKPADPRELLARVNNILKLTSADNNGSSIVFGDFRFELDRSTLYKRDELIRLTTTESELLKIFCQNQDKTLSRDELTFNLRGNEHNPYDRSIDVHINRLRNKIEADPTSPRYLLTTWGKGYRFVTKD